MRTKFTVSEKMAGERIISRLSEKSQYVYNETDPFHVYEYDNTYGDCDEKGAEKKLYAYDGALGEDADLTFTQLDEVLTCIYDELHCVGQI